MTQLRLGILPLKIETESDALPIYAKSLKKEQKEDLHRNV